MILIRRMETMKRNLCLIILLLGLLGCQFMTNDEIIAEVDKCKKAGLDYQVIQNSYTYDVFKVICIPPKVKF